MNNFHIVLGQNLNAMRKAKRVTQEQLAEVLGITFQQVQKYENGRNRIPLDKLITTCKFLGCDVWDIVPEMWEKESALLPMVAELNELRKFKNKIEELLK